jgi:enterochelin esterase-like enzyme
LADKKVSVRSLHSGTVGLDGGIHKSAEALHDVLQTSGVRNMAFGDKKGLGHKWQTWRYGFHDFAPRLF